jgi:glucose-1-phosphate thymidylyltransferase
MKGVVLCGGLGTRLKPLTDTLNKHLLPVWSKPMVFYPLELLAEAGIVDVLMVVGGQSTGDFLKLLKDGKRFGLRSLYFVYQEGEGGIAHALSLAEPFVGNDSCCVVLGDNVMGESLAPYCKAFLNAARAKVANRPGARVLLSKVPDPQNYGIPQFLGGKIKYITEKPQKPDCDLAVIGVYFYDCTVFEKIKTLKPSERKELEITDVNNLYAVEGTLQFSQLKSWWGDAGASVEALYKVSQRVANSSLAEEKPE